MGMLEFLKNGQIYQFVITIVILLAYVVGSINGHADDTLRSILLIVVGYWFAVAVTKPVLDTVVTKVQALDDTIKSQVVTNQLVTNQKVDSQTVGKS